MKLFADRKFERAIKEIYHAPIGEFPLRWSAQEDASCDWIPNSFDFSAKNFDVLAIPENEPWETIRMHHDRVGARQLLGIFPAVTQLDIRFERAVRALALPCLVAPEEQMRAPLALVDSLSIGGLVLMHQSLDRALKEVAALSKSNLYFQVILGPDETPPPEKKDNVFYEIHLVPGLVGLFQCAHLGEGQFHMSERFVWEFGDMRVLVSDPAGRFARARLPICVRSAETIECPCGRAWTAQL